MEDSRVQQTLKSNGEQNAPPDKLREFVGCYPSDLTAQTGGLFGSIAEHT